jgi:hypothetical protein
MLEDQSIFHQIYQDILLTLIWMAMKKYDAMRLGVRYDSQLTNRKLGGLPARTPPWGLDFPISSFKCSQKILHSFFWPGTVRISVWVLRRKRSRYFPYPIGAFISEVKKILRKMSDSCRAKVSGTFFQNYFIPLLEHKHTLYSIYRLASLILDLTGISLLVRKQGWIVLSSPWHLPPPPKPVHLGLR